MRVLAGLLLLAAPASAAGQAASFTPVAEAPDARGVWRSNGYGYLLAVGEDGLQLYHEAAGLCLRDPRGRDPDEQFRVVAIGEDGRALFAGARDATHYEFRRLASLPEACTRTAPWTRRDIMRFATATLAAYYPYERRGIDAEARLASVQQRWPEPASEADLFDALAAMLEGVNDPHAELSAVVDGVERSLASGEAPTIAAIRATASDGQSARDAERAWLAAYRAGVTDTLLRGAGHTALNDRLFWGVVDGVGYLNLVTMGGFGGDSEREDAALLDTALDQAMADFATARAVIVDVGNNRGGYDLVGRALAARFADRPRVIYTKTAVGSDAPPQAFVLQPSPRARYLGPVYLLTSDITVSAGETFTAAMRALPNVAHFGTATRGALSDQIVKPLPNGWTLGLAAEIFLDANGYWAEPNGFAPCRRLELFPATNLLAGHAAAVKALVASIPETPGTPAERCRSPNP